MTEKDKSKEQRDLESGDNPTERERTSDTTKEKQQESEDQKDLESGDNPSERERSSGN